MKYKVEITFPKHHYFDIEVEADNQDDAEATAIEKVYENTSKTPYKDWEQIGLVNTDWGEPDVYNTKEINEEE